MITLKRLKTSPIEGAKVAADQIESILGTLCIPSELPQAFFDDQFVLGFIHLLARALAAVNIDNAATPEAVGHVYAELFSENGAAVYRKTLEFSYAQKTAFRYGYQAADKLMSAMSGSPRYADDPVVSRALKSFDEWRAWPVGDSFVKPDEARYLCLFDALFGSVLRERFPEMNIRSTRH